MEYVALFLYYEADTLLLHLITRAPSPPRARESMMSSEGGTGTFNSLWPKLRINLRYEEWAWVWSFKLDVSISG